MRYAHVYPYVIAYCNRYPYRHAHPNARLTHSESVTVESGEAMDGVSSLRPLIAFCATKWFLPAAPYATRSCFHHDGLRMRKQCGAGVSATAAIHEFAVFLEKVGVQQPFMG